MLDQGVADAAFTCLENGGVVGIPTDTVYGIACKVTDENCIRRLYKIKERDQLKAIAVLIGSLDQISQLSDQVTPASKKLMNAFWPGALTIIMPKKPSLPSSLTQYPTVGVRMPAHPWLNELMEKTGPLAATSANISGQPSLATAGDVLESLDGRIDLLIDGGRCEGGVASTVVDCTASSLKILRPGAISEKDIRAALN